jgi:hypothetical protein
VIVVFPDPPFELTTSVVLALMSGASPEVAAPPPRELGDYARIAWVAVK